MRNAHPHRIDLQTLILLLIPPLFWAGNFIAGRALHDAVPPVTLSIIRWSLAGLCLLPFAAAAFRRDLPHYFAYRWHVLGTAITGVTVFNLLIYWGLHSTSATNGLILNSFIPFLVALLGFVLYRQRLHLAQLAGLCISLAGVLVVVSHGQWQRLTSLAFAPGDLIILIAMVCWALYTLWLKQIPVEIDRKGLMLCQIIIALVVLLPLLLWERHAMPADLSATDTRLSLLYIGIFPSVIALLAYAKAVTLVGSVHASLFIHAMPVFGSLLSSLLLAEPLHAYQLAGMLTIFSGIAWASRTTLPASEDHP